MKVFVAVVVIAAFYADLITAISDEQNEALTTELKNTIVGITAAMADLEESQVTWVDEVNKNLTSLQSSSFAEIIHTFFQTFGNITLTAEGKNATGCIESASSSMVQYLSEAAAALDETRKTALDDTDTQDAIFRAIRYGNVIIRLLNTILEDLDCFKYHEDPSNYCNEPDTSTYDLDIQYFHDNIDVVKRVKQMDSTRAYSTASKANAETVEAASEQARSVEDTAAECIALL